MAFPESFKKQTNAVETLRSAEQLEQTVRALSAQALGSSPLTVERFMREASKFDADDGGIIVRSYN